MCPTQSVFMLKGILITILYSFSIAPQSQFRVNFLYSNQKTLAQKQLAYYYTLISGKEEIGMYTKATSSSQDLQYIFLVFLLEMLLMALFKHQRLHIFLLLA